MDKACSDLNHCDASDENKITRGVHHILEALPKTSSGSHNLIVYPDMRVLRKVYAVYIKSLLENNEIVLVLTHYDHPSTIRQILRNGNNGKSKALDVERYTQDGSLVIVDSLVSHFSQDYNHEMDKEGNKLNFLSLIRILLNHGIKNSKSGITIFSDMGSFFYNGSAHYTDDNDNDISGDGSLSKILEYERSIPSRYKDLELKEFCLYHQKDYESHFKSTRQKAQLLDSHSRSILIMDSNNSNNDSHNIDGKNK
jgi:hypothetical protein